MPEEPEGVPAASHRVAQLRLPPCNVALRASLVPTILAQGPLKAEPLQEHVCREIILGAILGTTTSVGRGKSRRANSASSGHCCACRVTPELCIEGPSDLTARWQAGRNIPQSVPRPHGLRLAHLPSPCPHTEPAPASSPCRAPHKPEAGRENVLT